MAAQSGEFIHARQSGQWSHGSPSMCFGLYQSFAKFFSKLGGVYDFPFREISREIRVVIWLFLPRNSSLGWEELGKSTVRDRNGQSPEKKMRFGPPGWPFSQEIEHFHQTIDKHD